MIEANRIDIETELRSWQHAKNIRMAVRQLASRAADEIVRLRRTAERMKKLELAINRYLAGDYSCNGGAEFIFNEAMADPENYEPPDPPGWEGGFAPNH